MGSEHDERTPIDLAGQPMPHRAPRRQRSGAMIRSSGVYVVRIWLEAGDGGEVWRASATDTATKERHFFADPATLGAFFASVPLWPAAAPPDPEE